MSIHHERREDGGRMDKERMEEGEREETPRGGERGEVKRK